MSATQLVSHNDLARESIAKEMERRLCARYLSDFSKAAWRTIEPETKLNWNWHHDLICEYLQAVYSGQIRRLIINVQPRSMKSILTSVDFPAWVWVQMPSFRFMFGSYAESLARKHSVLRRDLIESPWYQNHWGDKFQLKDDQNTKTDYSNDKTGIMRAAGILGSVTGEGADCIVLDDPQNPKNAYSPTERENTLEAIDLTWSSRLNDKKTGRVVVIMQRLHEQDVTGHLIAKNAGYEHLILPAEAEDKQRLVFPITQRVVERKPGDILHETREGRAELEALKKDLGPRDYAGQYQQRPAALTGNIVQRNWIQFYKKRPEEFDEMAIFADLTFKEGQDNDFTVVEVWGRIHTKIYLIDQVRARMGFPAQIAAIRQMKKDYPEAIAIVIEEAANGAAVLQTLSTEIMGLVAVKPHTSKEARLHAVTPLFQAMNVYYPDASLAPWVENNLHEILTFPNAKHDDTVDVATMALTRLGRLATSIERLMALTKR